MIKKALAFITIGVIAVAAYIFYGQEAVATEVTLYKNPQCGCCESYADYDASGYADRISRHGRA